MWHPRGLVTVGQVHQPGGAESLFGSSDKAALCQKPGALVTEPLQQTPVPWRTWQGSSGLLPGHGASAAFPGPGAPFPVLRKCSTEVTYTLQTVFSLLPLQRGAPTGAASLPQGSGCASPGQCSQAPDPPGALQCPSPPAQEEPLTVSASAAAEAYSDCGFVQSPPAQPPSAAECVPCGGASGEEKVMEELSFDAILDILDKMLSPPNAEIVPLERVESEMSAPQSVTKFCPMALAMERRGAPTGAASLPQGSGRASPGQCSQAPDPPGALQCPSPPAQEEPLTVSASAAAEAYSDCGFVQSPPAQPPSAAECVPCGGASGEEKVMEELSFDAILDILDKMLSPPNAEIVPLERVESEIME
ncbi:heat shock factor protein 5-like [Guaruba guarouba]